MGKLIFITGGARSGKSRFAEKLFEQTSPKAYVATAFAGDDEMKERIRRHRERRGDAWQTIEAEKKLNFLLNNVDTTFKGLLVDCITIYTSNLVLGGSSDGDILAEMDETISILKSKDLVAAVVSNEVGDGIVPGNALSRRFRDILGLVNQKFASGADEAYYIVAGIPIALKK